MSIRFEKVSHEYSPKTPFAFKALSDIDLEFAEGKMTAIIGSTGSGKSTLVQHLNALLLPTEGKIEVFDKVIEAGKKIKETKDLRSQVGLVFQFSEYQLFEETVVKDVAFGPQNFGVSEKEATERAVKALLRVGIRQEDFERSPLELSGGQKRRVAIAGILAMAPKLLVLDEPTAGLDPQGAKSMMDLFKQININSNITIVIVTHNMEHVLDYCDNVVVLEKGRVITNCSKEDFFKNPEYTVRAQIDPPTIIQFKQLCQAKGVNFADEILNINDLVNDIAKRRKK